jgi:dolichol-phosphate mannosyltransferase
MDISVVLPVLNEGENLPLLLPRLREVFERQHLSYELIAVDGGSSDGTGEIARKLGAIVLPEDRKGYGGALLTGFAKAQGDYLLTLDADMSHEPAFFAKMWRARERADITIASRYVHGGVAYTAWGRRALSRLLNETLRRILSLPVRDVSSGFRLYRREAVQGLDLTSSNIEVLEEILAKAYSRGFSVQEVPFTYFPRAEGKSHARVLHYGTELVRSAMRLREIRNSVEAADYDERAFYTLASRDRSVQRRRHRIFTTWARGPGRTLHLNCGSAVIMQTLDNAVGLEENMSKLRFLRRNAIPLVRGNSTVLPFKDSAFDCLICPASVSSAGRIPVREIARVLREGGRLIVSTFALDGVAREIEDAGFAQRFTREQTASISSTEEAASYRKTPEAAARIESNHGRG